MATSIRLAPETERRLDRLATRTGRTKAFYLREIIERGLENMENSYLGAPAPARVRPGGEHLESAAHARGDHVDPRRAFLERTAPLRSKTAGRAHTPAETLIREDRQRRGGISR